MKRRFLPFFVVVLVVSGCGDSDDDPAADRAPTSTSSPSGPGSTTATTSDPSEVTRLEKFVLKPTDFAPGWTAEPPAVDTDDASESAAIAKCLGVRDSYPNRLAELDSAIFSMGQAKISSSVSSFRTEEDVASDVAGRTGPRALPCLEETFKELVAKTSRPEAPTGDPNLKYTTGSGDGPSNVIGRVEASFSVTSEGRRDTVYIDTVFVTGKRLEGSVTFTTAGSRIPAALRSDLVGKVAARMAQA